MHVLLHTCFYECLSLSYMHIHVVSLALYINSSALNQIKSYYFFTLNTTIAWFYKTKLKLYSMWHDLENISSVLLFFCFLFCGYHEKMISFRTCNWSYDSCTVLDHTASDHIFLVLSPVKAEGFFLSSYECNCNNKWLPCYFLMVALVSGFGFIPKNIFLAGSYTRQVTLQPLNLTHNVACYLHKTVEHLW